MILGDWIVIAFAFGWIPGLLIGIEIGIRAARR